MRFILPGASLAVLFGILSACAEDAPQARFDVRDTAEAEIAHDTVDTVGGDTGDARDAAPETVDASTPDAPTETARDAGADTVPDSATDTHDDSGPDGDPETGDAEPDATDAETHVEDPRTKIVGFLSGAQEVPSVDSAASGTATLFVSEARDLIEVRLAFLPAGPGPLPAFSGASLHLADVGNDGPVLFTLAPGAVPASLTVLLGDAQVETSMSLDAAIFAIETGRTYINVYSQAFPGGELRAQLGPVTVNGTLSALQVPDPSGSSASGVVSATFNETQDELEVTLALSALPNITAAHLHEGPPGLQGPVFLTLPAPGTGTSRVVFKASEASDPPWPDIVANVLGGHLYASVHTVAAPDGALRAHLGKALLRASLSGAQAVPPIASDASGMVEVQIDGAQVGGRVRVSLSGVGDGAAIGLYGGELGEAGPLWFDLGTAAFAGSASEPFLFNAFGGVLPWVAAPALLGGHAYVAVMTEAQPDGALRGQLGPARLLAELTGEQAVPPVTSAASGTGVVYVDGAQSRVHITLAAPAITDGDGAHLHAGPPGVAGDLLVTLAEAGLVDAIAVTILLSELAPSIAEGFIDALLSGATYLDVHTRAHPSGEIRGQLSGH